MRRSRLQIVKSGIFELFDKRGQSVYTLGELDQILADHRNQWRLLASTTLSRFLHFLEEENKLTEYYLDFSYYPVALYSWGIPTSLEIAMRIRPQGYLSHFSAMQLHGLVGSEELRTIYVNEEQKPKRGKNSGLRQDRIDAAFRKPARISNNKTILGDTTFYLLNGKHTNRLGVVERSIPSERSPIRLTNVERTLIDATVRPAYAGGVGSVLEAYRNAAGIIDIQKMADMLKQLGHTYPYHQAIGFYLERSNGYPPEALDVFGSLPRKYDFYLDYEMKERAYSKSWRIYYPTSLG